MYGALVVILATLLRLINCRFIIIIIIIIIILQPLANINRDIHCCVVRVKHWAYKWPQHIKTDSISISTTSLLLFWHVQLGVRSAKLKGWTKKVNPQVSSLNRIEKPTFSLHCFINFEYEMSTRIYNKSVLHISHAT